MVTREDGNGGEGHHSARATVPHCFYCDAVTAWFFCNCEWVQGIRVGKYAMPRVKVVGGRTIIIHDAGLIGVVESIGRYPRYESRVTASSEHSPERNPPKDESVTIEGGGVTMSGPGEVTRDRAAYMRDRRKRERELRERRKKE